jgi:hypothetical protein
MEEKRYAIRIPRAITTGIIFEAAEKFGLEVDQEKSPEDGFDPISDLPTKDYVPQILLWGDSPEKLFAAKDYIYKKHEEWINGLEEWRNKMRRERILSKMRK